VYINEAYLRDWWMYDAEKNTWERKADYPGEQTITPFTSGAVRFCVWKRYLCGSGFNSYSFSNRFWKYNTLTDAWTQINDFTSTSRAIATALNADGRIFFGTGYHTYNLNDWWEYLPSDDSWKKRREMPDGGRVNALSFAVGNVCLWLQDVILVVLKPMESYFPISWSTMRTKMCVLQRSA
jgi:N-acetylneuraminic acid mutarotase